MKSTDEPERIETVVIGGGQAGLAVGYHLARRGLPFVILDANPRIGDSWRHRWDSLRLFTPARSSGLPGMPFPASGASFPTKDEVADYLEAYATRFELPVRSGTRVDRLSRSGAQFLVAAGDQRLKADNVVVAMSRYQLPRVPSFASELHPNIVQLDATTYRNPAQLQPGPVLVVGAHDTGTEIAFEVAKLHQTWLAGRNTGQIPFRIEGAFGRHVGVRFVMFMFHRVLKVTNPIGRAVRPKVLQHAGPAIRIKEKDLAAAGIARVPRIVGARDGLPHLEDGRVLEAANVIWCTGFAPDFSWIDLPVVPKGAIEPMHERGMVPTEPGLYFVGLFFLYAGSSALLLGVGRDAERIVKAIESRATAESGPRPVANAV